MFLHSTARVMKKNTSISAYLSSVMMPFRVQVCEKRQLYKVLLLEYPPIPGKPILT